MLGLVWIGIDDFANIYWTLVESRWLWWGFGVSGGGFVSLHPNTSRTTALLVGNGRVVEASIYVRGTFSAQRVLWYCDYAGVLSIVGVGIGEILGVFIVPARLMVRYTIPSFRSNIAVRKVRVDLLNILWIVLFESVRNLLLISNLSVVVLIGLFGFQDFRDVGVS